MSATGSHRDGQAGFTLVELLVVLTIVGLTTALVPFVLPQQRDRAVLDAATQEVAATLRRTRSLAISGNAPAAAKIELAAGRYAAPWMGVPRALPEGVALTWKRVDGRPVERDTLVLSFAADGSADTSVADGVLAFSVGEREAALRIDWLTGRVVAVGQTP